MDENENSADFLKALGIESTPVPVLEQEEGNNGGTGTENQDGGQGSSAGAEVKGPTPSEIFGESYGDWEKVKTEIPQQLKDYAELKEKYKELSERPQSEFADETISEFNAFVKNTGNKSYKAFEAIKNAASDLDPIEAIVLKRVIDNPEFGGKEDLLRKKIIKDFGLDPENNSEDDIDLNKVSLNEEARKVFDWFKEMKGKINVEKPDLDKINKAKEEKEGAWLKAAEKVIDGVTKFPVPFYNEKDKKIEILTDFEVKPEIAAQYKTAFAKAFAGYDLNDKNIQAMADEYRDRFMSRNLPHIISHALSVHEAKIRQELEDHYAGGMERLKPPGGGGTIEKDFLDEQFAKLGPIN